MTETTVVPETTPSSVSTKITSVKTFVKKHRVALAVTATSIAWSSLLVRNSSQLNKFLEENNLLEKYYDIDPTDLAEVAALHGN